MVPCRILHQIYTFLLPLPAKVQRRFHERRSRLLEVPARYKNRSCATPSTACATAMQPEGTPFASMHIGAALAGWKAGHQLIHGVHVRPPYIGSVSPIFPNAGQCSPERRNGRIGTACVNRRLISDMAESTSRSAGFSDAGSFQLAVGSFRIRRFPAWPRRVRQSRNARLSSRLDCLVSKPSFHESAEACG